MHKNDKIVKKDVEIYGGTGVVTLRARGRRAREREASLGSPVINTNSSRTHVFIRARIGITNSSEYR